MINVNWIFLGTAIGALGTAVYLRDTLRGTTKPNRVTWLLWAFAPLLAAAVELDDGVGLRALPTFMIGFMPLLVFVGSFHNSAVGVEDPAHRLRLRRHVGRRRPSSGW